MKAWSAPRVPRVPESSAATNDASWLHVFDTAREALVPVGPREGTARMYVCGITPYDATHLGHAFTYVTFDLLQRQWRDLGLAVNYAQNITDVDDPLLERAAQTGQRWEELAESQIELFRTDMTALRVIPPDHYIGVVECIPCVLTLIEQLRATGEVYQVDDGEYPDWYLVSEAAPGFGAISHLSPDERLARFTEMGGDPERPGKRHRLDQLLWRMARPGEPSWGSELGRGRPGWHVECSAIALTYLGPDIDVQGGGSDLVFPHHEMSAAAAVLVAREPFAEAYVHSGMVALDGEKMSKSKGNLELVSRLRKQGADPMAVRLALLAHHYRSNWEWTASLLDDANQRLGRWRQAVALTSAMNADETVAAMRAALRSDLDAAGAIAAVDAWADASITVGGDDTDAPALVADAVDALLGVSLR